MQNKNYGDLFKLIKSLAGVSSFTTQEQGDISRLINRRLNQAYNTSPIWDRYLVSSQERDLGALVVSGFSSTTSTDQNFNGAFKLYGTQSQLGGVDYSFVASGQTNNLYALLSNTGDSADKYIVRSYESTSSTSNWKWQLIQGADIGENTNGTFTISSSSVRAQDKAGFGTIDEPWDVVIWTETSGSAETINVDQKTIVPYTQTPKPEIGEFIRIHRKKAFLNNSSIEYDFFVDFDGANILNITNTNDNEAFVTYKKPLTELTTSSDFENSTESVPGEFFHYLAHSVYADFLRMDGQHGKALTEEKTAQDYLDTQLEKIDIRSNNNSINKKFTTYVNRQSR